jgi:hypothetical protein
MKYVQTILDVLESDVEYSPPRESIEKPDRGMKYFSIPVDFFVEAKWNLCSVHRENLPNANHALECHV